MKTQQIQLVQEKLKTILPPPLCDHFVLANIDKETLTLHTDSSAWAARLRFKTPDILSFARQLHDIDHPASIRIKVVPSAGQPGPAKRTISLSSKSAQLIRETAATITDPHLRDALMRLSQGKS